MSVVDTITAPATPVRETSTTTNTSTADGLVTTTTTTTTTSVPGTAYVTTREMANPSTSISVVMRQRHIPIDVIAIYGEK